MDYSPSGSSIHGILQARILEWVASWPQNKKSPFWSVIFSYSMQQWTISRSDCDMWQKVDFTQQLAMTSSVVELRSSKALPKAKLAPKNSNGHCLVIWSTTAFQIPAKPLHLRSMRSKSMKCTENCNACRQHWSIGCAQFFHVSHNQCFKRWMNWATKFCLILSSDLSATDYFFFKQLNFLQGKCFHNQQDTENAFQVFVKFWSTDFYTMK